MKLATCWVERKPEIVVSLFKCTRPPKAFLPLNDTVEALKKSMVDEGFTKEPAWYRVEVNNWLVRLNPLHLVTQVVTLMNVQFSVWGCKSRVCHDAIGNYEFDEKPCNNVFISILCIFRLFRLWLFCLSFTGLYYEYPLAVNPEYINVYNHLNLYDSSAQSLLQCGPPLQTGESLPTQDPRTHTASSSVTSRYA